MVRTKRQQKQGISWGKYYALAVIFGMSLIFALRYKAALTAPNFYAEDGTVFIQNIADHNMIGAALTAFNGYLVVGQYIVADAAYAVYGLFGLPFSYLPFLIAGASCLFLGITASLPFILFRREMGWLVALATSVLIAFTPMPGSDYAIIGTIGNLKFAFLFWALLFVIYRNIHYRETKKAIMADAVLLICVLTNGPVVALLPFVLWPYRMEIIGLLKKRSFARIKKLLKQPAVISLIVLFLLSATYVLTVYVKGIPVMAGYLTAPYMWQATDNILYRVTVYSWLFPLVQLIVSSSKEIIGALVVLVIAAIFVAVYWFNKRGRLVFSFGLVAIAVSTLAFVVSRPGVSEYMLGYEKFPDQFFYTQSMIFTFITMWVIAPYIKDRMRQVLLAAGTALFVIVTAPYGSSFGKNQALYKDQGDIYRNTAAACLNQKGESVTIPIYPSPIWKMKVDRDVACE